MVEHGLGRPRRVLLHSPRHEYGEHAVTPGDGLLDDFTVVGCSGNDGDLSPEPVEFADALLPAHAHDLVAPIERVLHHVLPQLAGRTDDTDSLHGNSIHRPGDAGLNHSAVANHRFVLVLREAVLVIDTRLAVCEITRD